MKKLKSKLKKQQCDICYEFKTNVKEMESQFKLKICKKCSNDLIRNGLYLN